MGRAAEREALAAAIAGHRLVTAVGPGGVGKTRLAIAVAAETVEVADAVWFVDLVPISDPGMVAAAVAAVLGVAERPGGTIDDAVLARLGRSEALIVLDNCEHLVDGVAVFVERLLATCPQARVLATSRTRLMLPFEHVFPVPGLSLQPDDGEAADAVALFLERARRPPGSSRARATCPASPACAARSTAWRSPSSWPLLASPRWGSTGWSRGWPTRCGCCRAAHGSTSGTAPSAPRSIGAMPCSSRPSRPCSGGCRSSRRRSRSRPPPRWPSSRRSTRAWPTGSPGWPTTASPSPDPAPETRYRVLETIRQYGVDQLEQVGELEEVRARQVRWCLATAEELVERADEDVEDYVQGGGGDGAWRGAFDLVADDLRAGFTWAVAGGAARRRPPAGVAAGVADVPAGPARRGAASLRGGGDPHRRPRRAGSRRSTMPPARRCVATSATTPSGSGAGPPTSPPRPATGSPRRTTSPSRRR